MGDHNTIEDLFRAVSETNLLYFIDKGWKNDIQVMAELRDPNRPKKRKRDEYQRSSFPSLWTEEDDWKEDMKKKFSKFIDSMPIEDIHKAKEYDNPRFIVKYPNLILDYEVKSEGMINECITLTKIDNVC